MPFITLPQPAAPARIWYADHTPRQRAPGPPLVLVHGAGGAHVDWPPALRRLPGVRTLAPDLPGHGRADPPGRDSIAGYAAALVQWLDVVGVAQAAFCGHSMGGAICLALALDHPARVAGLVLIGTGARLCVAPDLLEAARADPEAAAAWVMDRAWGAGAPASARAVGRARLLQTPPNVTYGDYAACAAFDVTPRLGEIRAPALVIGAPGDQLTPFRLSAELAARLPDAELVAVSDAGHMLTLEQPEVVAAHVARFLRRLSA